MELDLPELTDEELAVVEGNFEDEPDEDQEPAEKPVEKEVVEEEVKEEEPEDSELDRLKKANAGLLNDLRETRQRGRDDRDWRGAVEQRLDMLIKKEEPVDEDPEPDRDENPVEWLAWKQKESVKEEIEPLKKEQEEKVSREEFEKFDRAVRAESQVREQAYLESEEVDVEEYNSRLDDLRLEIGKQFKQQGMSARDAVMATAQQEREFTIRALQDGLNPAQEAMRLWEDMKPGRAPWREKDEPGVPVVDAEEPKKPLSKVDAAKAGQKASGVGSMSGVGGKSEITMAMLAEMDPDDPIAQAIYSNEKKFYEINVNGKTTI